MVSTSLWTGESLVLGIIMTGIGILVILLSMPLAKGNVKAHEYNYRPMRIYKLSNEEMDWPGKPTAIASMAVAMLFVLAGMASIALGATGNAGPVIMYLFMGTIIMAIVALLAIMIASVILLNRAREKIAAK